jgi:CubicO group peptidase (beta-lactamase class C family)
MADSRWSRISALDQVVDSAITSKRIVGAEIIAARDGEIVYHRVAGYADRESARHVQHNELFRLASMTKAIVSATTLALMDRGWLQLNDPVTRWLPDFRPKTVEGHEPIITIRHLLTHTAGLSYGFLEPADGPYHQLGVSDGLDESGLTLEENLRRIAAAPLLFEPGTNWHYSIATDVLGAVIARVSRLTLPEVVKRFITDPLGMSSTRFVVPPGTLMATPYGDAAPEPLRRSNPFTLAFFGNEIRYSPSRAFNAQVYSSGGVGMVGTAADYLKFLEAIRSGGAGILRPDTAAEMTRNAIGELASAPGFGWGLGMQVLKDPTAARSPLQAGAWNWGGLYGTHFWVDPAERLSFIALTNTAIAGMIGEFPAALQKAVFTT